jgi:uracil-DNA glycosylase family 4
MAERAGTVRSGGASSGAGRAKTHPRSCLQSEIVACRACPRLVRHRESVARQKRRAFAEQEYWGKPIPGFGDPRARLLLIGLAPAAHGGNRTGRMFTGDRSGEFLYAALHRAGFASQPHASYRDDGLRLRDCYITAAVRCAPPQNRPSPAEISRCAPFLEREFTLLPRARVVVCLGALAFRAALDLVRARGEALPRPLPRFGHGVEARVGGITLLGCYHPSQQNTFTGRLTAGMIDRVLERALRLMEADEQGGRGTVIV